MIFAIEGPDCAGKSTLFEELKGRVIATFVRLPAVSKVTTELMQRELDVWEALYDPRQVYVCDRHVITTDRVYAEYYGRKQLRSSYLEECVTVVYLAVSETELIRRHKVRGETVQDPTRYGEVLRLYEGMCRTFPTIVHLDLKLTARCINEHILKCD